MDLVERDWKARAQREAAAIIAEALPNTAHEGYEMLVSLVAIGWLQGVNMGSHETLAAAESAFVQMQGEL